jgi:alcohol-forming fatty acyl-CoA reductase
VVESTSENAHANQSADPSSIRAALRAKRILVTGVTGFLGTALLERLLADIPEAHVLVLVRSQGGTDPRARIAELVTRPAFRTWRERDGAEAVQAAVDNRVTVIEGDLAESVPDLPNGIDVAFHCAASVSFDPPIDHAFQTNLLGGRRLYEAIRASGSRPHVVHVSTAYVAGVKKGIVPEETLAHTVDWRAEGDAALAARQATEDASRKPELLDRFIAGSRKEHGRAGPMTVAEGVERRRQEWVDKRLVQYGRARAQSLGWPDVYTFTKALGERMAEEMAAGAGLPLSIVRPSIVESALVHPYPGWIEGFKMAEPIILAYGRGALPEFPAIPEVVSDIIPVDLVVNAMLAIAANPPDSTGQRYYHICSGSRNPLTFRMLYELVNDYFQRHPLPERGRGEIRVPEWRFPGRRNVEKRLRTGERLVRVADTVVSNLPRSDRVRELVRRIDRERGRMEFARRYADLYGAYTEMEVLYTDRRAGDLLATLPAADRRDFDFDPMTIDWRHYLQEVHCPAVDMALRWISPERPKPEVRVVPRQDGVLAVFDMEGTLLDTNVIESFLWLRMADLPRQEWPAELLAVGRKLPAYLFAERRDRGEFLRAFYRRYRGASEEGLRRLIDDQIGELLLRRLSPAAARRIREHRAAGHRTMVITGALDCFVEPLRPLFDEIVAARLQVRGGRFTGDLATPPLVGEARAAWLRAYAGRTGADLKRSYAYADSHTDLPLLRAVGNPVAVNPDAALFRVARKGHWPLETWRRIGGTPRILLPELVS